MPDLSNLPRLEDLPIPAGVRADDSWSEVMHHMAAHIGPFATLSLCDRHGGRVACISRNTIGRFADVLTRDQQDRFAHAFAGEKVSIPIASRAILHAKRAGIIAAVRAGYLSAADGAFICRTPRRYFSALINQTTEGVGVPPVLRLETRETVALRRAADAIGVVLSDAGVAPDLIAASKARLLGSTSLSPYLEPCGDAR